MSPLKLTKRDHIIAKLREAWMYANACERSFELGQQHVRTANYDVAIGQLGTSRGTAKLAKEAIEDAARLLRDPDVER